MIRNWIGGAANAPGPGTPSRVLQGPMSSRTLPGPGATCPHGCRGGVQGVCSASVPHGWCKEAGWLPLGSASPVRQHAPAMAWSPGWAGRTEQACSHRPPPVADTVWHSLSAFPGAVSALGGTSVWSHNSFNWQKESGNIFKILCTQREY